MTASGIHVRPIGIADLLRLRSMRPDALMPDQTYGPVSQRLADPWSTVPVARRDRKSFVASLDGRVIGLVDLLADSPNHRWVLSRLLSSRQLPEHSGTLREAIWRELMLQAIRAAGAARAKRIHAVLSEDSPVIDSLVATGFAEYAQDTVLTARSLSALKHEDIVRRQDASDVWAVHQLYHSATPRPVQYAEALTSNFWGRVVPGQPSARSYVVEDGFEIIAHCRVSAGVDSRVLSVMVHPDALHLLEPVVMDVAADIGHDGKRSLSVVVPDYLQEYIAPLESVGFEPIRRQTRLVKYTVVARRMQFRGVEELAPDVRERAVTGTPSMYYAPPQIDREGTLNGTRRVQEQNGFS